jgi:hypothetical protein
MFNKQACATQYNALRADLEFERFYVGCNHLG